MGRTSAPQKHHILTNRPLSGNRARLATALQLRSRPVNSVSREEIIEAWTRLCDLDETETGALVKKFMDEQPALGVYLFANMEEI
jgi:hypothetical protein